jgi:hypothetical protein
MEFVPRSKYKILAITGSFIGFSLLCIFPWLIGLVIRVIKGNYDLSFAKTWQDGFVFCMALYVCLILLGISTVTFRYCRPHCITCCANFNTWAHDWYRRCKPYRLVGSPDSSPLSSSDRQSVGEVNDLFIPEEAYRSNQL